MVHVNFDPDSVDWNTFFQNQQGNGYYFEGAPYQRGYGIGAIFANLFRYLLPIGRIIGQELGKEGLALGSRVLGDISTGTNIKEALTNQSREGIKKVVDNTFERAQTGRGRKKLPIKKKTINRQKKNSVIGKSWSRYLE